MAAAGGGRAGPRHGDDPMLARPRRRELDDVDVGRRIRHRPPGRSGARRSDGAGDRRSCPRRNRATSADAQHAGVGPRAPSRDPARRRQLAAEALAIAAEDGDSGAAWRRPTSPSTSPCGSSTGSRNAPMRRCSRPCVRRCRTSNVQLELTAMLFALGRPAGARATRRAPGHARRVPRPRPPSSTSRCSRSTRCSSRPPASLSTGRLRRGPATGRRGSGGRGALARRERRGRLRRRSLPHGPRPRSAGRDGPGDRADWWPRGRCGRGRSPVCAASSRSTAAGC